MKEDSMIGKIIDLPFEDFKEELVRQEVNIGTMNNIILNLEAIYFDLRQRKDALIEMKTTSDKQSEITNAISGLYAEMTKIEQKVVYLKERTKELISLV